MNISNNKYNVFQSIQSADDADDNEFGSFTSCKPISLLPKNDSIQMRNSDALIQTPISIMCTSSNEAVIDETFQDFQGCVSTKEDAIVDLISPRLKPEELLPNSSPLTEWLQCLNACHLLLAKSDSVLSLLNSSENVNAFLTVKRGNDFVFELIELYGIIHRLRRASNLYNLTNDLLQSTFAKIDNIWCNLLHFVKSTDHKEALQRILHSPNSSTKASLDLLKNETHSTNGQRCSICMMYIEQDTESVTLPVAPISLSEVYYHSSCANLWLNNVHNSLPSLRPPP